VPIRPNPEGLDFCALPVEECQGLFDN
jgi:hypothetical protein